METDPGAVLESRLGMHVILLIHTDSRATLGDLNRATFQSNFIIGSYLLLHGNRAHQAWERRGHAEVKYEGLTKRGFVLVDVPFLFIGLYSFLLSHLTHVI